MMVKKENKIVYFQFPNLAVFRRLRHGVFTRIGGTSEPPFHSLNTGFSENDDRSSVGRNRSMIADCLDAGELVFAHQTHGAGVLVYAKAESAEAENAEGENAERESTDSPESAAQGDAMVTDLPKTALAIQTADCQAVLLYDPVRHVAANVHSGWRGSVANIVGKTVGVMADRFGCDPAHISAGIGPSLGPCCAEFVNYRDELPEGFLRYKDGAARFDFWQATCDQLAQAGLRPKNVASSGICSRCNPHLFYSYRKEGRTGRFSTVIGLA